MITTRSGEGWRTTISGPSGPEVSIWAHTEMDAEYMSAMEHMRQMERDEAQRMRLEQEFAAQAQAEFMRIRARA